MMKNFRLILVPCFLITFQFIYGQNSGPEIKLDSLARNLGEKFMKNPQSVGLSIGVYDNGKSNFYNFGTTGNGKEIAPSKNTIYEIASITKTFTSYLLAKAVLEKKIKLSDDIRKYVDGEYPNLEFAGQPIQIVHLANTTSGIPEWIPAEPDEIKNAPSDSIPFLRAKIYGNYSRKDFFDGLHQVKLDTVPGFKVKHSNGAAQLLAYILENVFQMSFEKLVQQYILKSNGMNQTFFVIPNSKKKYLASGYNVKGILMRSEFEKSYFRSMGGLRSSASDLLKYIRLQLDKGNEIVSINHKRTVDVDAQTGKVVRLLPDSLINAAVYSIGLNWFLYQPEKRSTQIWSDGGSSGFCSYLVFYPELNSGVVVLANNSDEKTFRSLPGIAYEIFKVLGQQ